MWPSGCGRFGRMVASDTMPRTWSRIIQSSAKSAEKTKINKKIPGIAKGTLLMSQYQKIP